MSRTSPAIRTSFPLSTVAIVLGVVAAFVALVGWLPLMVIAPGDLAVIGVVTVLSYLLPVAGVVVGHVARRREGARTRVTVGLALSYGALAVAVVPLVIDVVSFAALG